MKIPKEASPHSLDFQYSYLHTCFRALTAHPALACRADVARPGTTSWRKGTVLPLLTDHPALLQRPVWKPATGKRDWDSAPSLLLHTCSFFFQQQRVWSHSDEPPESRRAGLSLWHH